MGLPMMLFSAFKMMISVISVTCGVFVCLVTPAFAARTDDAAVTRTYLRASYASALSGGSRVGARVAAVEARANGIATGCPSALTYAPRDAAFWELGEEMGRSLWYAGLAPARSVTLRLAAELDRLRWSDRMLTRLVHSQASEERAIVGFGAPDVCAQIEAWRVSDYATLPASVEGFLKRAYMAESDSTVGQSEESREKVIMRLLRRYEGPAERRLAARVERLETRAGNRVFAAFSAVKAKLAAALGVSEL